MSADSQYCPQPMGATTGSARVSLVCRAVTSRFPELDGVRILDLGSYEGSFSYELALRGADVVSVEGREHSHEIATRQRDDAGLTNWTTIRGDVLTFPWEAHDPFDVVLCLGLLYHLTADSAVELLARMAGHCTGMAVIETQMSTAADVTAHVDGHRYDGRLYRENPQNRGDALDDYDSFWFTETGLMEALAVAGFGLVTEIRSPRPRLLSRYVDHGTWIAYPTDTMPSWVRDLDGASLLEVNAPETPDLVHTVNATRWNRKRMERAVRSMFQAEVSD